MTPLSTRAGVLAAGNWIVDHVKLIDTWPSQDALVNIEHEQDGTGGAPFNVLVDLARLGAPFPLAGAGRVGDDPPGDWVRQTCGAFGIDTAGLVRTAGVPTSYTDVMTVRGTGRRTFFHQRGANALLGAADIGLGASRARFFYLGYLLLLDRLDGPGKRLGTEAAELLAAATAAGFQTATDLVSEESDRYRAVVAPALPHTDVAFLNELEAGRFVGCAVRRDDGTADVDGLRKTAVALRAAGGRRWGIIHFPEGVLAVSPQGERVFQPSLRFPPRLVRGSAGAGDALAAGVLFGLHEGSGMREALRYGVCAAAASLRDPSCTSGLAPLAECLGLGERYGFREDLF